MAEKRDYLKECNEFNVPVEDFRAQFCARCLQPECGRSQHGSSRFESRVHDWEKRLFLDVPSMAADDPRFETIRAKKFVDVDMSRPAEVRDWADPRDLPELELESDPTDPAPPPTMPVPDEEPTEPALGHEEEAQELAEPEVPPAPAPQGRAAIMNTPTQPKMMVGGKKVEPKQSRPVFDQWEPREAETDGLQVVKPGAKIRLGS